MEISLKMIIFVQDISNAKLMEFKKLIDRGAELERMNEAHPMELAFRVS